MTEPTLTYDVQMIPLGQIAESPMNPRKTFAEMDELTEDVRQRGILQPVLVRPSGSNGGSGYELVFGARRYRAAVAAKLEAIPAMVRKLPDDEALELMIVENCKRADIHPLEEAEGYRELHERHGHSVEDIAAKVGKSKASVYARMKLCDLVKPARKAFLEGKLSPSVALLVARMPRELQEAAAKDVTHRTYGPGWKGKREEREVPLSFREASERFQRDYMLRLADATFPKDSPELVPAAGPCTTCPKRTGNQRELFDDVKSADVCMDPGCFRSKLDAHWERVKADASEMGYEVLAEAKAKKVFPKNHYGNDIAYGSGYVDLERNCDEYNTPAYAKKYSQLLKNALKANELPVTLAQDRSGQIRKLVSEKAAKSALKKAGLLKKASSSSSRSSSISRSPKEKAAAEAAKRSRELREKTTRAAVAAIAAAAEKPVPAAKARELWRTIARLAFELLQYDVGGDVLNRRQIPERAFEPRVKKAKEGELRGIALELLLAGAHASLFESGFMASMQKGYPSSLLDAARLFGVDFKKLEKELAAADAKPPEPQSGSASAKKKAPAKARGRKK